MTDCIEVLFVSDSSGKVQTASCFDPQIGTTLMSYKGGNGSLKNSLCVIGKDYLLSAEESKPILHIWDLNSQEPSHELKMVLPGKPSAVSVSSDGNYCVGGIDGKIYIWLISSGCLLNVISKHYQDIKKIIFTDDSSHFITAGEDGLVLVWKLAEVVSKQSDTITKFSSNPVAPVYTFSEHSLPVTDIYVGRGSLKGRLFTVSVDQTCKIFCLGSGTLLVSLMFNQVLSCLTVNDLETELFVGTNSGKINLFDLDPYPRSLEYHVSDDADSMAVFIGHSKTVTCLSTSIDGVTLASGSDDGNVFIWNIPSKQLIRSFEMRSSITNLFFCAVSNNIFSNKFEPSLVISKFEKVSKNLKDENLELNVWVRENLSLTSFDNSFKVTKNREEVEEGREEVYFEKNSEDGDVEALKQQIVKLKEINKQLYQFAMNKILQKPISIGINSENSEKELDNTLKEVE